jgi:predicted nucleic acid-binding protein
LIVLDASVLIAHLEASDAHHRRATDLLLAAVDEPLAASPLTLAEVLVGPVLTGTLRTAQLALEELEFSVVLLADDGPQRLATLRATYGLRLPDCCVLLAAESAGASVATFEQQLMGAAGQLGLVVRQ